MPELDLRECKPPLETKWMPWLHAPRLHRWETWKEAEFAQEPESLARGEGVLGLPGGWLGEEGS